MRILVATDGSRGGCAAVKFAGRLASRDPGTELVILTVGLPPFARGKAPAPNPGSAKMKIGGVEPTYRFVPARSGDSIPETISREAERLKADLVVIGSEGRDTLSEWVVGGVALRLIYVARRPVTVVRPPRRRKVAVAS
ncbi:MAG TPA: universal stress protein [Thermoanaerobaculia bacterium]|nr:universal stress protein [Thermoanaerobaculia bacterium]